MSPVDGEAALLSVAKLMQAMQVNGQSRVKQAGLFSKILGYFKKLLKCALLAKNLGKYNTCQKFLRRMKASSATPLSVR
jgi:hypothetical protein